SSVLRSRLDYGSCVYGSARPSALRMLDPIHHQGLRLSTGAFRTSPIPSLYAETNEWSLEKQAIAPWEYSLILCDFSLTKFRKRDTPPECIKQEFYEIQSRYAGHSSYDVAQETRSKAFQFPPTFTRAIQR
ncbi:uncharacterized protein LOC120846549, partial [Ixodes scapularis]|uniref:uncharacterized protein LOC120846549 n=1 Tax=Ixodes scapularis TaxID=6945 RepID=UPI001C387966